MPTAPVIIFGAGPSGLTAAYELSKAGKRTITLERDNVVGGISQTVQYKGYRFDIGGHRFFTKVGVVEQLWKELLEEEMIERPRLSRIFYKGAFFDYPLKPMNALTGLGIFETVRCVLSYGWAKVAPTKPEDNFEAWVSNRFGKRLYGIFFKTYTEKVWGIPCTEIQAEWAAQRIKGLSLTTAVMNALFGERAKSKGEVIKTLIDKFLYPKLGPGQMWETCRDRVRETGSDVVMEAKVEKIHWDETGLTGVTAGGERYEGEQYLSTIAIKDLVEALDPPPPPDVLAAGKRLKYRDFLTVALVVDQKDLFPDTWIYIHESSVKLGRVQNFKNWSPYMVPDENQTCLGLEYFVFEGDDMWEAKDEDLIALGKKEIGQLGLADPNKVVDGAVARIRKAYPIYDGDYSDAVDTVRKWLGEHLPNLQLSGRNGMHRYNNQDHSMLTAMLAVRNILGGKYDLWQVNVDKEYHEEGQEITLDDLRAMEKTQPQVPRRVNE